MSENLFVGATTTDKLIGRVEELAMLQRVVARPSSANGFYAVLLQAAGGKGKTRLLREMSLQARNWANESAPLIVLPVIDVADPKLHNIIPFLERVYEGLAEAIPLGPESLLTPFIDTLDRYRRARDSGASYTEVSRLHNELVQRFEQCYEQVTIGHRVVWALDTMEQLYATAPEIESLITYAGLTERGTERATFSWLRNFLYKRPHNTIVVLAGRPTPEGWVSKLTDAITTLASIDEESANSQPTITLLAPKDFSLPETCEYIASLAQQLGETEELRPVAEYLDGLLNDHNTLHVLYTLTAGNPIKLALYIDLLVSSDQSSLAFSLNQHELEAMSVSDMHALQYDVEGELLDYIARALGNDTATALEALSMTRRGLDSKRFVALYGIPEPAAKAALQQLARLSFVKQRNDGSEARYYLHDELYSIYQRAFLNESLESSKQRRSAQTRIFGRLVAYCDEQIRITTDELFTLLRALPPETPEERLIRSQLITELRTKRRSLQAEWLHYALYLDPVDAFDRVYQELAEQAFASNDPELHDQLQAELELFYFGLPSILNQHQTSVPEERWHLLRLAVLHERVTATIRRLIQSSRNAEAAAFARDAERDHIQYLREYYPEIADCTLSLDGKVLVSYYHQEWRVHIAAASLYHSGKVTAEAIATLQQVAGELEHMLRSDSALLYKSVPQSPWIVTLKARIRNLIAQIYSSLGAGYTTLDALAEARDAYQRADQIYRSASLGSHVRYAEVKNNFALVLAELGAIHIAESVCEDAIKRNERLGLDYRVATGYITRATISLLAGRTDDARSYARQAVEWFRRLGEPRGIGLSLYKLGEACRGLLLTVRARRQPPAGPLSSEEHVRAEVAERELYVEAEMALAEALHIFRHTMNEGLYQIEVVTTWGCLARDQAVALQQREGDDVFDRALKLFDEAIELAHSGGFNRLVMVPLIEKAWLYVHSNEHRQALSLANQATTFTPEQLQLIPGRRMELHEKAGIVDFQRLAQIEALRAEVAAADGRIEESFEHCILESAYLRLFTHEEGEQLRESSKRLYKLISEACEVAPHLQVTFARRLEVVVSTYGLSELELQLGPLPFRRVVADLLVPPEHLDYLNLDE